ncbi:hypothetical protein [Spirosoma utsteinense]|uniref:IrrE N-terminal-like domain-containing protein n=1 Tax=Spirosoma utsteinense TaxID=2585773 RepID=A0ABR6W4X6_9BACT|nr:hypothetical protein [Spirosoma utsteinense]MBC3785512.1 hypothetical protein [Spirosoma utsteinense]MBC3791661.1 hypothetical protein [Spirosoma utsteinense]
MADSAQHIDKIYAFLEEIGIPVVETTLTVPTFLPGILIDAGRLTVDLAQLSYAGDILHEAGHIAVTLPAEREQLHDNIMADRPDKAGDEMAVLLWSYAAGQHLGLPSEVIFHAGGYKGQHQWLIDIFTSQTYIGLPLLVWMGMTQADTFPAMTAWLRPA